MHITSVNAMGSIKLYIFNEILINCATICWNFWNSDPIIVLSESKETTRQAQKYKEGSLHVRAKNM